MTSVASPLGPLGAPGIFFTAPDPVRSLVGVPRDVAAFLGVAPRGPVRAPAVPLEQDTDVATWLATAPRRRSQAVAVTSWDEYRRRFGGYDGPGRLPYAVSAFFAGGGRLAHIVRVVHEYAAPALDEAGCASGTLGGLITMGGDPVLLRARDEGRWGDGLRATLRFSTRPVALRDATTAELVVDRMEWVPQGSLLRMTMPSGPAASGWVDLSVERADTVGPQVRRVLTLATAAAQAPVGIEVVTARLEVLDNDPAYPRHEELGDLGLRADHPRWLARALIEESSLVWPGTDWAGGAVAVPDVTLGDVTLVSTDAVGNVVDHMTGGQDRWQDIVIDDFFDPSWVPGDELPGDGVQCLADHDDVGLVLAPDLYDPLPLAPQDDVSDPPSLCGPEFDVHVEDPPSVPGPPVEPGLDGLRLDPRVPAELAVIVRAQQDLLAWAEQRRDLTVLLDVPLGLVQRQILAWRNQLDSAYAAAYHPWLDVVTPADHRDALVRVNPSAFAAAVIADREQRLGVQHGPANAIAVGAVRVADTVLPAQHDALHVAGVDVFVPERDGIRLTGARTLSRVSELRQLSVVRLMTVLRLTLERQMTWAVFEPGNPDLWAEVRRLLHDLLTRFFEAGAFRGATTKEAFFVRCDRTTMTRNDLDNGRLVCLVGVAPVEPVEYVVIEIALTSDSVRVASVS